MNVISNYAQILTKCYFNNKIINKPYLRKRLLNFEMNIFIFIYLLLN